jgi:hypothetical protein
MAEIDSNVRAARFAHGALALLIAAALVTQFFLSWAGEGVVLPEDAPATTAAERIVRFFSFFTVQSNIIVCAVSALLAIRPDRDGPVFRVFRLLSLTCITVTGVVVVAVLIGAQELEGLAILTDAVFHYVAPIAALAIWLLFGPRPRVTGRTVGWSLVFPVLWVAYTLVRGEFAEWYPYPFIDVNEHGYGQVFLNIGVITVLYLAVAGVLLVLDRRLAAAPRARAVVGT